MMKRALPSVIFTDIQFWIPVAVLIFGISLLVFLR